MSEKSAEATLPPVASDPSTGARSSESVAIATLAIGEQYLGPWREICEPGWRAYAETHGYDVVCLTEPPDRSARARSRSPAWQKCLLLSHEELSGYDRVVWVDADVVVNPTAPPIVAGVPRELIGAVDEFSIPGAEALRERLEKLNLVLDEHEDRYAEAHEPRYVASHTAADYYRAWGLPGRHDAVVQTGVMVLSPAHHTDLIERVYHNYEQRGGAEWNYEMRPLSFELMEAGAVHWLDPRFNCIWDFYRALRFPFLINHPTHQAAPAAAGEALSESYFVHFAGRADQMSLAQAAVRRLSEVAAVKRGADISGVTPREERRTARRQAIETPVALAIYARADTTAQVLGAIREARPRRLLVFGDAAPADDPAKGEAVAGARTLIESLDWDCEVETDFADQHMGLRPRIESGLDWVFERAPEAIILEDDCVPHPSFFPYCEQLLRRYRDEPRIMVVSGDNFQPDTRCDGPSYSFTRYPLIWGWATWRQTWLAHDRTMSDWPALRERGWLAELLEDPHSVSFWTHMFDQTYSREIDTWDFSFLLSVWRERGLSIEPCRNLVSNLGFRGDATHTKLDSSLLSRAPIHEMDFPLVHPDGIERNRDAEAFTEDVAFSGNIARLFETIRQRRRNAPEVAQA